MPKLVLILQVEIDGFQGDAFGEGSKIQQMVEELLKREYDFPTVRIRDFFKLSEETLGFLFGSHHVDEIRGRPFP